MLVHLGSEKEKEIERKREKEIIKNNKEKIKKGYLIEVVNFLPKKKKIEVIKNIIAVVAAAVEELVAGSGDGSGSSSGCGGCDCCLL